VDSENYYATLWSNNLRDTDAVLHNIYDACVAAGPTKCPIYENSTSLIETRVNTLLTKLKTKPIPFFEKSSGKYAVVDYSQAKGAIFTVLYRPHSSGRNLTVALAELEKGNAEPIWRLSNRVVDSAETFTCSCPAVPPVPFAQGSENTLSVACGDGPAVREDVEELREFYDEMAESSMFAESWWIHLGCSGWKIPGNEQFTGSFKKNTSYPLLLIGNTADPVTPLWNAHKMSKGFNGSVVLTQNSPGHCSSSATSLCTTKAVRAYFRDGTLPNEGTVCEVESSIFDDEKGLDLRGMSVEDQELLKASRGMQENYFVPILPHM